MLSARLMQEQGIDIIPLHFKIPFCHKNAGSPGFFESLSSQLKKDVEAVDINDEFLRVLEKPRHGFGSNLNPCIDCKILMLKKAKELMPSYQASFVVTGEVLGQRPMSQHRQALAEIERESGLSGFLVRPLCARLLDESIPEKNGWIKRELLLNIGGRGRRRQMDAAEKLQVTGYSPPAGGCLLTDPGFSRRLRDLMFHHDVSMENIALLKTGRHFRLSPDAKLVVGRDEKENLQIEALARENDYLFMPDETTAGPAALGRGMFDAGRIQLALGLCCRYCDQKEEGVELMYKKLPALDFNRQRVAPLSEAEAESLRL